MPITYLFVIGLFTTALCGVFLYVSIHEMRRLNPGPAAQERDEDRS
jgi:hypothetical protein